MSSARQPVDVLLILADDSRLEFRSEPDWHFPARATEAMLSFNRRCPGKRHSSLGLASNVGGTFQIVILQKGTR